MCSRIESLCITGVENGKRDKAGMNAALHTEPMAFSSKKVNGEIDLDRGIEGYP